MVAAQVRRDNNGVLMFRVNYDDMPSGFLDLLEDSDFSLLCNRDKVYTEFGHPVVDCHIDPRIILMRQRQIHPERTCGQIRVTGNDNDGFYGMLMEYGPHAHMLNYLMSIDKLYLSPRLIYDEEGILVNIGTFDVVESI